MKARSRSLLLWVPRILAILVCFFLSLFALDGFGNVSDFAIHVAPMSVLLAVALVSWRWEWVGGVLFTGLGVGYAVVAHNHVSWVLCISVPLLVVGVLFLWSWHRRGEMPADA